MIKFILAFLISPAFILKLYGQTDTMVKSPDTAIKMSYDPAQTSQVGEKNGEVYRLNLPVDLPVTIAGTAWSLFAFTKIYNKDSSTAAEILALDKNDIAKYNRWGVNYYSPEALSTSNIFFYGAMPLPLLLLADKKIRHDAGKVGLLFMEAMSITGFLYTGSVYFHDKYRPYTYNPDVPMSKRTRGGGKNSFFAGHVALVGTSTFFMAKVYSDYHPESRIKWVLYSIASGATLATAYLRSRAGEHFFSDIVIGTAIGTLSGILVPQFHKIKDGKEPKLSLVPLPGDGQAIGLVYRL
jgi:membrane-associated phospholipid phosphatase